MTETTDPWAEMRAEQEAAEAAEAERWGLTPDQWRYARAMKVEPDIYKAMTRVAT